MSGPDLQEGRASSRDGRTFTFGQGRATTLVPGDLVVLRAADGGPFLGQVLEQPAEAGGVGIVIGELDADGVPQR